MATKAPITLRVNNDETLLLTITPDHTGGDLAGVTEIQVYLKDDSCTPDGAAGVLLLSSLNPAQVLVTSFTPDQIVALAYIPASALAAPYERFWRADALSGPANAPLRPRRTALYGPVSIIDL